jgi:hypothetical protein
MLVPDLFGGNGIGGQPTFFNSYNLAEVTGYVGLVPIVAGLALATRSVGRRRDPRSSDWGPWLALVVVGMLLTWGSYTPLGHLFAHIPLFGKTRLQSRNLGIVDLSLAVLLGFWVDRALTRPPGEAGLAGWRRWVALAPVGVAGMVCLAAIVAPGPFETHYGAAAHSAATLGRDLTPWLAGQLAVVIAVGSVIVGWRRIAAARRRRWLAAVIVLDLALFVTSSVVGLAPDTVLEPSSSVAAPVVGVHGRFAVYDTTVSHLDDLTAIGQPDLNAFTRQSSVQGYGSILSDFYGTATGTHTLDALDTCALADGTFAQLRLATLVTEPEFLAPGVGASGRGPAPTPPCPRAPEPGTPHRRNFYFGWPLPVASVDLVMTAGTTAAGSLRVGVLDLRDAVTWPKETVRRIGHGGWEVRLSSPRPVYGLRVAGPARAVSDTSMVTGTTGGRWVLDGPLQDAVSTAGWRFAGTWNGLSLFSQRHIRPPVWIAGKASGARVEQVKVDDWGTEVDRVRSPRPVTVVRSEAYLPGWHVLAVPAGKGPVRTLPVEANGLVQAVEVPKGAWTLTFLYRPRTLNLGLAGSAVGAAVLAGFVVVWFVRRRRADDDGTAAGAAGR